MAHPRTGQPPASTLSQETTLKALVALSALKGGVTAEYLLRVITNAPDVETAKQAVASCFETNSVALDRKWAEVIINFWTQSHSHVPLLPHLPLTSEEVSHAPILRDSLCLLAEIAVSPAAITKEGSQAYLTPEESLRLALVLPSWPGMPFMSVEHELAIPCLNRLRSLLQAAGLLRIHQGQLKVVQTRYRAFISLPPVNQYYVLWHTEMYHVAWSEFASLWSNYIEAIQAYLPILWELHADIQSSLPENSSSLVAKIIDAFEPVWEEEGLHTGASSSIVNMYQQAALPAIIEKLIVQDILVRYGLLQSEPGQTSEHYMWTDIAHVLFAAEHHHDLPCGVDMLKEMPHPR